MKQTKAQTILFSTLGVGLVFLAIVGVNLIFSPVRGRVDLTAEKVHTLSDGTKKILSKLDGPVEIRLYASKSGAQMPSMFKNYLQNVEDMLAEFQAQARGNIEIKKFDPEPDSDAEDSARQDSVEPQQGMSIDERFYLGLVVSQDPQKVALPFLSPQREALLEYDIARAISQVMSTNKPVVGVMTPLPMFGNAANPMMARMGQQGSPAWFAISELKRDFDVQQVDMTAETIDPKIKILVVVHPKDISDKSRYAIDQFVLRGGKLIAFLDGMSLSDNRNPGPMGMNMGGGSSMPKLLKGWGLEFDTSKVVADLTFGSRPLNTGRGQQIVPAFLFLNAEGINTNDAVTAQADSIWLPFSGVFTGSPSAGLKQDVLLKTTAKSQLVDGMTAQFNGAEILDKFKPSGTSFALAVRLTGKFKTAFPDGNPGAATPDADKKDPASVGDGLKEATADGVVYLFGDADMLADNFSVQVDRMFGMAQYLNSNLILLQGLIEQAAGDVSLIGTRSRGSIRRPFTKVQQIQSEAQQKFQSKIQQLQDQQKEAQEKLSQVQVKREGNKMTAVLTPEQQNTIAQFKKQQTEASKSLRQTKRDLRQDVESLENKLKWTNIALMPLLVTATGVLLAVARRKKQNAR